MLSDWLEAEHISISSVEAFEGPLPGSRRPHVTFTRLSLRSPGVGDVERHPATKPVMMITQRVRKFAKHCHCVLETLFGSSSTRMAGEKSGRIYHELELAPFHVGLPLRPCWPKIADCGGAFSWNAGRPFNATTRQRLTVCSEGSDGR
jgi:hypothetical protein